MALRSGLFLRALTPRLISNTSGHKNPIILSVACTKWNKCREFCQGFSSTAPKPKAKAETVTIYFVMRDGTKQPAKAKIGDNLLDVILDNHVDIDGFGACEGTLACSTCHLIFKKEDFSSLPDKATDEELDMLDLAYDLTDTSRLGCQIVVEKKMEGWEIRVPAGVSDARGPS